MTLKKQFQNKSARRSRVHTSWDPVADWYAHWVGENGCKHQRNLAIPAVLELLGLRAREQILDVGAGSGVLASYITQAQAYYTGVDISTRLLCFARKQHGLHGRFLHGDARRLKGIPGILAGSFDVSSLCSVFRIWIRCNPFWNLQRGRYVTVVVW